MIKMKAAFALLLVASAGLISCHEKSKDPVQEGKSSFSLIQDQHGLVLSAGKAYANLIKIIAWQSEARTAGMYRVNPFNASASLLYHKLIWEAGHHSSGLKYGSPMPLGGTPLSVGQIEFVRRWIESGSPEAGSVVDTTLLNDPTPSYIESFSGLKPPSASEGIQLKLETFMVNPNFERELFVHKQVGNTEDLFVNRVRISMRPGSHHFILYDFSDKKNLPPLNTIRDIRNPDGSLNAQTFVSMQNHVFWAGTQTPEHDYSLPEGTALLIPAGSSFDLNSHYVNKTAQSKPGEVHVNLYTLPKNQVQHVVSALNLANQGFVLPPGQRTTSTKSFTFKKPTTVLMLTSHTHKLGEKFVIRIKGGNRDGELVYESKDWEHPLIKNFPKPLMLAAGEGLTSEITYNNTTAKTVRFGLSSEDEMGIIFGYYYEN
jgi:hypothetical protein